MRKEVLILVLMVLVVPFVNGVDDDVDCIVGSDGFDWDGTASACSTYCFYNNPDGSGGKTVNPTACEDKITQCGNNIASDGDIYSCGRTGDVTDSDGEGDRYCDCYWDGVGGNCLYWSDWCFNYYSGNLAAGKDGRFFCEPAGAGGNSWCDPSEDGGVQCDTGDIYEHAAYCHEHSSRTNIEQACFRGTEEETVSFFRYWEVGFGLQQYSFSWNPVALCTPSCVDNGASGIDVVEKCTSTTFLGDYNVVSGVSCPATTYEDTCDGDLLDNYECSGSSYTMGPVDCSGTAYLFCHDDCGQATSGVNLCDYRNPACREYVGNDVCGVDEYDLDNPGGTPTGENFCDPSGCGGDIMWLESGESNVHGGYTTGQLYGSGVFECCGDDRYEYIRDNGGVVYVCCNSDGDEVDGAGACVMPPTCTDDDGDGFAIEGGICGDVDCDDDTSDDPSSGCPGNPTGCTGVGTLPQCAICKWLGAPEDCEDDIDSNCGYEDEDCDDPVCVGDPACVIDSCGDGTWDPDGEDDILGTEDDEECDAGDLSGCTGGEEGEEIDCVNCNCVYYVPGEPGYNRIEYGDCVLVSGEIGEAIDTYYFYDDADVLLDESTSTRTCYYFEEQEPGFGTISIIVVLLIIVGFYLFRKKIFKR